MLDKLIIAFVVISIGFVVTVELMIRKGKLKRVDTYSYKAVVKRTIISFYLVVIISLLVYLFSKSLEVTVSLGILLLFGRLLLSARMTRPLTVHNRFEVLHCIEVVLK